MSLIALITLNALVPSPRMKSKRWKRERERERERVKGKWYNGIKGHFKAGVYIYMYMYKCIMIDHVW